MKIYQYIRPTLLGASALVLSACSYSGYSSPSVVAGTPQAQNAGSGELMRIANSLADSGNHEAAIPIYRHLGAQKGEPAALAALAESLIAQGATDDAMNILSLLIERGQANSGVWYSLGKTQLAKGRFAEALTAFNMAAALPGVDAKMRSGQAVALAALGRTGDAIAAFKTSTDRLTLSNKALVLAASGFAQAAIHVLEPVMRQGGGTSRDRQNLAMAYLLAGQDAEAYRLARLDLDPATINDTFTFYRSLASLAPAHRMQALVTGAVNPEWTKTKLANLDLQETTERDEAAKRLVTDNILARNSAPKMLAEAPKPKSPAKQTPKPEPVSRANYELKEIPPLLEPEGWALQIGAYRTTKNLMRGWTILYRESGDILEGIPPRRSEVDFGNNGSEPSGFYYRLNAGPLKTFARAKELCTILKERGTSCWIRPPETSEGKLPQSNSAVKEENSKTLTADASSQQ